jgi:hypothetical protein
LPREPGVRGLAVPCRPALRGHCFQDRQSRMGVLVQARLPVPLPQQHLPAMVPLQAVPLPALGRIRIQICVHYSVVLFENILLFFHPVTNLYNNPIYQMNDIKSDFNSSMYTKEFFIIIIISLLISPLLGHRPSLWMTHKEKKNV